MTRRWWLAAIMLSCRSAEPAPAPGIPCTSPFVVRAGACGPALDPCGKDSIPNIGGGCSAVGVADCGEGAKSDGEGGCTSVLPSCAPGTLAVPGETTCHELSACGATPYGDIPVDAGTLYVDGASTAGDGTRSKPFATIRAALDAAADNAIVAIADGTYVESLTINERVRIHGRCPSKVAIRGTVTLEAPSELHTLAIHGAETGVAITSTVAMLDRVWLHHSRRAVVAQGRLRDADVRITGSLVEDIDLIGIDVAGAKALIERSVVRAAMPKGSDEAAVGVLAQYNGFNEAGADVTLKRSLVEKIGGVGVDAIGSKLTLEGVVVRDMLPSASGQGGIGVLADEETMRKVKSTLAMTRVIVERARATGIALSGATATIDKCTVRSITGTERGSIGGFGITVLDGSALTLSSSLVRDTRTAGVAVTDGTLRVESCIIRDTREQLSDGSSGLGILAAIDPKTRFIPVVDIVSSLVMGSRGAGILLQGARGSIVTSVVRDTAAQKVDGRFGDGIYVSAFSGGGEVIAADVAIKGTIVEKSARAAVIVAGASMRLADSLLLCSTFDLEAGAWFETNAAGEKLQNDITLEDEGGNGCGCATESHACRAQSNGLEPVAPPRVR